MFSRIVHILAVIISCFAGCAGNQSPTGSQNAQKFNSAAGTIEYLQKQNLPALRAVQPWHNDYAPGLKITTDHYEILTTLLDPLMLRQLPGFVESAYRGYNSQLPRPIETGSRFTIYLFATRDQWEAFTESFVGRNAPIYRRIKTGAYYLNGACVTYNIGRDLTFSVIGHEGWHQFNSRHFKFRLPSWLDEGIAMLFESSRYGQGLFYFEPGRNLNRLGGLKKTLLDDRFIPLRELLAINPGEALTRDEPEAVTAFYSQSYALVRFLREDGYGKRLPDYHRLLLDGLNGDWPLTAEEKVTATDRNIPLTVPWNRIVGPKLFEYYLGPDFAALEQEYLMFCTKIVYHVHFK